MFVEKKNIIEMREMFAQNNIIVIDSHKNLYENYDERINFI